jgi:hypothetical protein
MSRSRKAAPTLVVLLFLGAASAALTSANSQTVDGALPEHPASRMATDRTRVLNDAAKPFSVAQNASSGASELHVLQSAPFPRNGVAGRSRACGSVQNLSHFRFWLSGAQPWLTR